MEENNKQLLIRDIYARLPYGVYVKFKQYNEPLYLSVKDTLVIYNGGELINDLQYLYLRPMSSMTEEEFKEYDNATDLDVADSSETLKANLAAKSRVRVSKWYHGTDWLIANHFDYRGLIPMGLALEAPEGMYNSKN